MSGMAPAIQVSSCLARSRTLSGTSRAHSVYRRWLPADQRNLYPESDHGADRPGTRGRHLRPPAQPGSRGSSRCGEIRPTREHTLAQSATDAMGPRDESRVNIPAAVPPVPARDAPLSEFASVREYLPRAE